MSKLQLHILQTLAYFDIFHYPLTNEEIKQFLAVEASQQFINEQLELLIEEKMVYRVGDFYALQDNLFMAYRRRDGNRKAATEMLKAARAARILSKFPFVEGLALSGSLSKNFADKDTDIDFFIIAATNRLWIARTLMHIFYKIAVIAGRRRWFCMNYYVDKAGMEIEEKNIFTAMEIITLIPMQGTATINDFAIKNRWTKNYFPAYKERINAGTEIKKGIVRSFIEMLFIGKMGDAVDNWLMRLTAKRWKRKERSANVNAKGVCMGMLAGKHFAKPDPKNFQYKILEQYDKKIDQLLWRQNKKLVAVK